MINSPNIQGAQNPTQAYASNIISIRGGREAAQRYPVANGYIAWLIDEENQTFYVKGNDANGLPMPLREFKYEEITPPTPEAFDPSKFVTKDDFNLLMQEIRKLQQPVMNNNNNRRGGNNNANTQS